MGDAEQSVTYADRSGDANWADASRTTHTDALHQAGRRVEAETRFRDVEQMQQKQQSDYPLLYSLRGFQYCDLLLAAPERAAWQTVLGRARLLSSPDSSLRPRVESGLDRSLALPELVESCCAVSQRAAQTLKWYELNKQQWHLDIALDHLTLGRAALYAAILESPHSAFRTPHSALEQAVSGLRRAGTTHHIPRALLTRAWLRFLTGACTGPESAQADLDEAWEIAERGPMRQHMADIHLMRARLFGSQKLGVRSQELGEQKYPWGSPAADLAAAEKLIKDCGYHRRDEELADAKRALLGS